MAADRHERLIGLDDKPWEKAGTTVVEELRRGANNIHDLRGDFQNRILETYETISKHHDDVMVELGKIKQEIKDNTQTTRDRLAMLEAWQMEVQRERDGKVQDNRTNRTSFFAAIVAVGGALVSIIIAIVRSGR